MTFGTVPTCKELEKIKIHDNRISVVANHSNQGELQNGFQPDQKSRAKSGFGSSFAGNYESYFQRHNPPQKNLGGGNSF